MSRKVMYIVGAELMVAAIFAFSMNDFRIDYDFFTMLGLANLILGIISGIVGLVVAIAGANKDSSILIASGVLLLLGCLTCSVFPF